MIIDTQTVRVSTGTFRRHLDGEEMHLIRTTFDLHFIGGRVVAADLVRIIGPDGDPLPMGFELWPFRYPPSPVPPERVALTIDNDGMPMLGTVSDNPEFATKDPIAVFGLDVPEGKAFTEEGREEAFKVARLLRSAPTLYEAVRTALEWLGAAGKTPDGIVWDQRPRILGALQAAQRLATEGASYAHRKGPDAAIAPEPGK